MRNFIEKALITNLSIAGGIAVMLTGCMEHEDHIASTGDRPTFEQFEASTYKEPWTGGVYIVNGDTTILNEKQLEEFYTRVFVDEQLIVNQVGGVDDKWNSTEKKNLTYCISDEFGSQKNRVIQDMEAAAAAWEEAADVDFIYVSSQDSNCTANNNNVVFDVRQVTGQSYLARAFFPSYPRRSQNVLIDTSSFNSSWPLVNILVHELGHVLGFRHEHTRPESGACFEDTNWRPLTPYDSASVMHYPQCNGSSNTLEMTSTDREGAAALYGAPGGNGGGDGGGDETGNPRNASAEGNVNRGQQEEFEALQVVPGSLFEVEMSGSGDPDLYVRFGNSPTLGSYDCRPYRWGASERCSLDVPAGETEAYIMIRGYAAGSFRIDVNWVEPQ